MKKNNIILLGLISLFILLTACGNNNSQTTDNPTPEVIQTMAYTPTTTAKTPLGDNMPITRGQIAKMIAVAFFDSEYINSLKRQISFTDTSPQQWYDKYINVVFVNGKMTGSGDLFKPNEPITLQEAQFLLDKLNPNNKLKLQITEETKNTPISYALWVNFYTGTLENLSEGKGLEAGFGIKQNQFTVLATPGNNTQLTGRFMITDIGPISFAGFDVEPYVDKEISALVKDDELLCVTAVVSTEPTIKNAYIVKSQKDDITIFAGGAERTYKSNVGQVKSAIADVTVSGGTVAKIQECTDSFNEKILQVNPKEIVFEGKGGVTVAHNFKVYSALESKVKWKQNKDLILGSNCANFFVSNNEIQAAVITLKPLPKNIRVAISTTGFTGLIHKNVVVSGTTQYLVRYGENERTLEAYESFDITDELFANAERVYVRALGEGGKVVLESVKRNWENNAPPKYRGFFEITKREGGYVVVNELDFEEYLYAVVPSEIPSSFGVEASEVQAISARSYAYIQYYSNRYQAYGANVDDSVDCQVYNNIPENDVSIAAVNATRGECLTFEQNVVSANFFSNSAGMTANSGEVWANTLTKQFPTTTPEYLRAVPQYIEGNYGDLSVEENARAFFKNMDVIAYDSDFNWFRWNTSMSAEEITASVNANLKERYEANPLLIKTVQPNGSAQSLPISSIGTVTDMEVTQRGEGGNIIQLKLVGTTATILVETEYNIRNLIRPKQYITGGRSIPTKMKDGKVMYDYALMPSAFLVFDKEFNQEGKLTSVVFYGGGYGHGVGMSQNGVKGMVDRGFTVAQILQHFYPGTAITKVM